MPEREPLAPPMRNSRQHLESEFYGRMRHKMPQGCHVPSLNSKHDGFQIHGLVSQHRQMLGLGNPRALEHCAQQKWVNLLSWKVASEKSMARCLRSFVVGCLVNCHELPQMISNVHATYYYHYTYQFVNFCLYACVSLSTPECATRTSKTAPTLDGGRRNDRLKERRSIEVKWSVLRPLLRPERP